MESVRNGVKALALVDRGLPNIHPQRSGGGNTLERGLVRNRKFKCSLGTEKSNGGFRIVLDVVLFGADQLAIAGLKDDHVGCGHNRLRIFAYVKDFHVHLRTARWKKRIKADALVSDADEHGSSADSIVRGGELALRVGFNGSKQFHAQRGAEKIDVGIRNGLARGAIHN